MPAIRRERADQLLVTRGLAESRERAQALVLAGAVLADGQKVDKPGRTLPADCRLELIARLPYVSRGGLKLAAALDHFAIDVNGKLCLDVGASTGGFTDCLLQRGAARVYAVDVGQGQLDWKLRTDPRVVVRENRNARYLDAEDTGGELVDVAVTDVSFISVTLIVGPMAARVRDDGVMVVLVKPQFEVGRGEVGRSGIVRDPALHEAACRRVELAVRHLGWDVSLIDSPVLGAEGNKEFLLYARREHPRHRL